MRASWRPLVESFAARESLKLFVVLVDLRRGPEREELELFEWLDSIGVPSLLVCTKADKLGKAQRGLAARDASKAAGRHQPAVVVSSDSGDGLDDLWRSILARV
jgi:GTP-binding protein